VGTTTADVAVVEAGLPPPQPASAASEAASNTDAEHLEIFWLMKKKFRTEALLCPIGPVVIMGYYGLLCRPSNGSANLCSGGGFHYL
jgi:hypothetical protein